MRRLRLGLIFAALLAGGVVGAVLCSADDQRWSEAAAAPNPPRDITGDLQPGEVGVIVTNRGMRLTTHTGVRDRRRFLSLAIDNRADRRVEVVLVHDTPRTTGFHASGLEASSSTLNETQVPPGRYLVIAREPTDDDDDLPIAGFARARLRVR